MSQKKKIIIAKFGGTSVANIERIAHVSCLAKELSKEHHVVCVVSAMAGFTNQLVSYCDEISPHTKDEEVDAVLASGEQITSGLLALQLKKQNLKAHSLMGWQIDFKTSGFATQARIDSINANKILESITDNTIPIIAGFQGINAKNRVSTLGRGGSDTSAVAIAAALQNALKTKKKDQQVACYIFTDVDGVYTADPRFVKNAKHLQEIPIEQMLAFSESGSKVLDMRSVLLAYKHNVSLKVLSSFKQIHTQKGTNIVMTPKQTIESPKIHGITHTQNDYFLEAKLNKKNAHEFLIFMAQKHIKTDLLSQQFSENEICILKLTFPSRNIDEINNFFKTIPNFEHHIKTNKVKISIIGVYLQTAHDVLEKIYNTLNKYNVNPDHFSISEVKIILIIDQEYTSQIIEELHNKII